MTEPWPRSQTTCAVCFNTLRHKAGRFSMNCHCDTTPCRHKLVCNACGVFFADETVKRREKPLRNPCDITHTPYEKALYIQVRYERCLAAHMLPARVGDRKKRRIRPTRPIKPSRPVNLDHLARNMTDGLSLLVMVATEMDCR